MRRMIGFLSGMSLAVVLVLACAPEPVPTGVPDAQPQGAFSCTGLPAGTCQQMLADARRDAPRGVTVVQMHIRCAVVPCTLESGQADAEIRYSDGSQSSYGMGWAGAAPAP